MTANARHMKSTPRWGTDEKHIELARAVLGGIDTDPCSEAFFNQFVRATTYYSLTERGEDGLKLPWTGRVLCNPAGGLVREFWQRLIEQFASGVCIAAVFVGFSIEQLAVLADEPVHPTDFSLCFLRSRIPFIEPPDLALIRKQRLETAGKTFKEESSPGHANYISILGVDKTIVDAVFGPHGKVQHGPLATRVSIPGSPIAHSRF